MASYQKLNFTSSNEDGRSELAALEGIEGPVLTLSGSGARPLDLLLGGASEVIALDANPAQNALLGLKIAAISCLEHDDLLRFLGLLPDEERILSYHRLRASLSPQDAAFWDQRGAILSRGVIYAGWFERALKLAAFGQLVIRAGALEALFNAPDLQSQAKIWAEDFDDRLWRGSLRLLARRWIWARLMGEEHVIALPKASEAEAVIARRFARAAGNVLFRESDVASLLLRGRFVPAQALPLHLQPAHFERLRARIGRLRRVQGGIGDLARLDLAPIAGFALSDFGSYCAVGEYEAQWRAILAVAAPEARFCERILFNTAEPASDRVAIDHDLSARLSLSDRAVIHDIRAGRIESAAAEESV